MLEQPVASPNTGMGRLTWARPRHHALLRGTLALLLLSLPFELAQGLVLPGGFLTVTNVELLAGLALSLWGALLVRERRLPHVPRWFVVPAVLFLTVLLISAWFAIDERGGALKFAFRQTAGALVALSLAERIRSEGPPTTALLLTALLVGGLLSALLGLWELSESPAAQWLLGYFKTEQSLMSGLLRLSATFTYANTAAMYYEALLPLALLVAVVAWQTRPGTLHQATPAAAATRRRRIGVLQLAGGIGATLSCLVLYLAVLLTFSRAALATCVGVLLLTPALVTWHWRRAYATTVAWALTAGLFALTLLLVAISPTFRLRLAEPEVAAWYAASYAPGPVAPMAPGEVRQFRVGVRNTGLAAWAHDGSRPFRLSYHWLDAATQRVVRFEGKRTPLPRSLAPGEGLELLATVQAPPQPGRYLLAWDLVRENTGGGWFSQMGTPVAKVGVAVAGSPVASASPQRAESPATPRVIEEQPPPPPRRALWAAAAQLWLTRPWFGIGPDVFRHTYGPLLGLEAWDPRIHTNNLYLELLVGSGILGLGTGLGLVGVVLWRGLQLVARRDQTSFVWWVAAAGCLGLVTFLLHGVLDVFLAFTPTYLLLWVWMGTLAGLYGGQADLEIDSR